MEDSERPAIPPGAENVAKIVNDFVADKNEKAGAELYQKDLAALGEAEAKREADSSRSTSAAIADWEAKIGAVEAQHNRKVSAAQQTRLEGQGRPSAAEAGKGPPFDRKAAYAAARADIEQGSGEAGREARPFTPGREWER